MNFEEFKARREEILRERPTILDCSQANLYASLSHLVPSIPASSQATIHRCHLAERWTELFDLPGAWAKRALISTGVRDSVARLFAFYAKQGRRAWIPADCYPVFQEIAHANGLAFREYATLPKVRWPLHEGDSGPDLLLAMNPLKPAGRWLLADEVARLRRWLAENSRRRLLLDTVYTFGTRFHQSTQELLATGQTILLHSLTKGWLRPRIFGVALVPESDFEQLGPLFRQSPLSQTNLIGAHHLMKNCSDLSNRVAAAIGEGNQAFRSQIERRVSVEIPDVVGYFHPVAAPWSRLLAEGILGIPATVFGSKSAGTTLLSSLGH